MSNRRVHIIDIDLDGNIGMEIEHEPEHASKHRQMIADYRPKECSAVEPVVLILLGARNWMETELVGPALNHVCAERARVTLTLPHLKIRVINEHQT